MSTASGSPLTVRASDATRWGQLVFGIICMVMTANLQYGWTLFVTPIDNKFHWGRASIQVAFSIFVLAETWLVPFEGYLIDKFGPKLMVGIAGALIAIAWAMNAYADSLTLLYAGAIIGGVGAGIIYGASVGNALKWFPDRRGLAAGLTAAGFGAGSALTIVPIANLIKSDGYEVAFLWFGLGQGLVVMLVALLLRAPEAGEVALPAAPAVQQTRRDHGPQEVLKTPVFWVMYAMFVLVGAGGLMATAQLAPIAKDFRVRQYSRVDPRVDAAGPDIRFVDRSGAQWHLSAVLRLGVRSHRAREHDVHCLPARRHRHLRSASDGRKPDLVRCAVGCGVLRLGGDLLVVSGDLHRHLWKTIRHDELRHAVHGERHCVATGAACQCAHYGDRKLACGVCHSSAHEHRRRGHGTGGVKADAY